MEYNAFLIKGVIMLRGFIRNCLEGEKRKVRKGFMVEKVNTRCQQLYVAENI